MNGMEINCGFDDIVDFLFLPCQQLLCNILPVSGGVPIINGDTFSAVN